MEGLDRRKLERMAAARLELDRRLSVPNSTEPEEMARACRHWACRFCHTFNPKVEPYHFRFELFPFQETFVLELVRAIEGGYDVFVDKCREMGATYTALVVLLWYWAHVEGSNFLLGSRKEDLVDNTKANSDGSNKEESLFGKVAYILGRMRPEGLPTGFSVGRHMSYMSLINPANGNAISGESSNENFSRGGRQKAIFLDEFAFWDNDAAAWGSTADTTNCRIVVTTPGIRPSKAKRLRYGEDGEELKVITLPWHLNPYHTPEWLERERKRRSAEDFAREIMIDWQGSLTGIVYPEIGLAEIGRFDRDPRWPLFCSSDYGLDGVAIIWIQKNLNTGKLQVLDYYENSERTIDFYYPMYGGRIVPRNAGLYTADDIAAIRELRRLKGATHYGDPDVSKRNLETGNRTRELLAAEGVEVATNRAANDFPSRREATKVLLQEGIQVNDCPRTRAWTLRMENARYPERPENSQATQGVTKPIHDWTSHGRTAFEYFAVNYSLGTGGAPDGKVIRQSSDPSVRVSRSFAPGPDGSTIPDDVLAAFR